MALSLYDIRRIANPRKEQEAGATLRILDSWAEYDESKHNTNEMPLQYLCYRLESIDPETGRKYHFYKAIRFARVIRLPKAAKQSTSLMDMHSQILSAVYEQDYNFITVIANVREKVALGLMFLYGIQGVADNIEDAKKKAHDGFLGLCAVLQGTFRVLEMRVLNAQETEWLREKLYDMRYTTVIRGIPKASETGEDAGNKGMGGKNLNPDSQGTLEEIITGMADYEYIIEIITSPVFQSTLRDWASNTEREMTEYKEQMSGTKGFNFSVSIPMMYGANQGTSQGVNKGYTEAQSVNFSEGVSSNVSYGENVGQSLSQSYGQSFGKAYGQSFSESISQTHTVSQGVTVGQTLGVSYGTSMGQSYGENQGTSQGTNYGESVNQSQGVNIGQSHGQSFGQSSGTSFGQNMSTSSGSNMSESFGQSMSQGQNIGTSESYGTSEGQNYGTSKNFSENFGESSNVSHGQSQNLSYGESHGMSNGTSSGNSFSISNGQSQSGSHSLSESASTSQSASSSASTGFSEGNSYGQSFGQSHSYGDSTGKSFSRSEGESLSQSVGHSEGASTSHSSGGSSSNTWGDGASNNASTGASGSIFGLGLNRGWGEGTSHSDGGSSSASWSSGGGTSLSDSLSVGKTNNSGVSESISRSESESLGLSSSENVSSSMSQSSSYSNGTSMGSSHGMSESYGSSYGKTMSESYGLNQSVSSSVSTSNSTSAGYGSSYSEGTGQSHGMSYGQGESFGQSVGISHSQGLSQGYSQSMGQTMGQSYGQSVSNSYGESLGSSYSQNVSESGSQSYGTSSSVGNGYSIGQSMGVSKGYSVSSNIGRSQTNSQSQSYSVSQSESWSTSHGFTKGESYTESMSENTSKGQSQSYGQSKSIGQGKSTSTGTGQSQSQSLGYSTGLTNGTSASMGISPSLGYSKSYQWEDQQVKDVVEMLEFQNERLKNALRGNGAFYSYVYIACPNLDALSAAKALAKSTWQNGEAMVNPLQVLNLNESEQQNILTHAMSFAADVTMQDVHGVREYKYCSVLLPKELVSYTHLPRVSEGGLFTEVGDVPKFSVPSMLRGEIFMGNILSAERYTMMHGYETPFQYRIDEQELMHMFFTGASRSGKTVAAMRFIAELTRIRRKKTGKRLRIVCMDPKQDWRALAKYVEPGRFRFYSMGNRHFRPLHFNPLKVTRGVHPQTHVDACIDVFCRSYGLLERGKLILSEPIYQLYQEAGVFGYSQRQMDELKTRYASEYRADNAIMPNDDEGIRRSVEYAENRVREEDEGIRTNTNHELITQLSSKVTFTKVYDRMNLIKLSMEGDKNAEEEYLRLTGSKPKGKSGNDTKDAYSKLLDRLQAFNREYSVERQLFGQEDGMSVDELIGDDDVTVLESKGLENTFQNFIFGVITSGFFRYALAHEGGFLSDDQYETVLVVEEANEVLMGSDTASSGSSVSLTGESEFEKILDQSAGYGLFIAAITQRISAMPTSIIANSGLIFSGRLKVPDDVTTVIRAIAREDKFEDRDLVKWFPRSPTGWFVCMSSRTFDFKDAEPILVKIAPLNIKTPSNAEIEEMMVTKDINALTEELTASR